MPINANTNPTRAVLDKIQWKPADVRFLQSWNAHTRALVYGYGDGNNGVLLDSKRALSEASGNVQKSRLERKTVDSWLDQPASVNGAAVFDRVLELLTSFVHFDDPRVPMLISLWVMGSYSYSIFSHYGYLFFYSTFPRSGKTRVLELISHLAFEATAPLNAPTTATIRDIASEGRTMQLDTLERWRGKSPEAFCAAMELLDAGFRNGGTVSKMVPAEDGWKRSDYPVYTPYSMAAISKDSLSDTALDRAFAVEMRRKSIHIRTRSYNFHTCERECSSVRDGLYRWALSNAGRMADVYEGKDLQQTLNSLGLNDRAADIWKPILAVGRVVGLDVAALSRLAQEMGRDPEAAENDHNLDVLMNLQTRVTDGKFIGTTTQIHKLLGNAIDVRALQALLASWGFQQRNQRTASGPRRVWLLSGARLQQLARELVQGRESITLPKTDYSDYTPPSPQPVRRRPRRAA